MSSELEFGSEIETTGAQLGDAIADLPEYESYVAAESAVETSMEAQEYIETFESKREQLMLAKQVGEATQDDVAELREIQAELHELPVMKAFVEAQQALKERLSEINAAISDDLEIDFAEEAGGCGCEN